MIDNLEEVATDAPPGPSGHDCQRWGERRARYRPSGERIDPRRYRVEPVRTGDAKVFVEAHHYSGTFVAAALTVGLWRDRGPVWSPELVGVAAFSIPMAQAVIPKWTGLQSPSADLIQRADMLRAAPKVAPGERRAQAEAIRAAEDAAAHGLELGRFVLREEVEGDGESWFLARALLALRQIRPSCRAVISASDPLVRRAADGRLVCPGHVGVVYQALNAEHVGRTGAQTILIDADARTVSARALSKIRAGHRGYEYATEALIRASGVSPMSGEAPGDWVRRATAALTRVRHPGCLMYRWALKGSMKPMQRLDYPKIDTHRFDATGGAK